MIKKLIAVVVALVVLATTYRIAYRSGHANGRIAGCFYTYKEWFPYLYSTAEADMSIVEHCQELYE